MQASSSVHSARRLTGSCIFHDRRSQRLQTKAVNHLDRLSALRGLRSLRTSAACALCVNLNGTADWKTEADLDEAARAADAEAYGT